MELQSSAPTLKSKRQKDISLKIRIKNNPMQEPERNASSSSSSTWNRCGECGMSFSSSKALFGHLRIHRKRNRGAGKTSVLPLRQARHSEDAIALAASILIEISRSISETDIEASKLCKLRLICDKIERQRKKMKEVTTSQSDCGMVESSMLGSGEESVSQCSTSSSNGEVNVGAVEETVAPSMLSAVGSAQVGVHRCDKCDKVFNSGQALGGHKRAHYTGPPLCRPGNNGMSKAVVAPAPAPTEVVVFDFDLNEPAEELFL